MPLRSIHRGTGSVVTWWRDQKGAAVRPGHAVAKIAEVTFTSVDRGRDVIHNFNTGGFDALYQVQGRATEDLHPAETRGDQEDRQVQAGRARDDPSALVRWPAVIITTCSVVGGKRWRCRCLMRRHAGASGRSGCAGQKHLADG